jgi:indole-3-glycerol phosphate synthase
VTGVLGRILEAKQAELVELRQRRFPDRYTPRPVRLQRGPGEALHLITEIKFRSPSAGALSTQLGVAERAQCYAAGGASMISVLCDHAFFGGSYNDLTIARDNCNVPLLCKEFIIDESQLDAARAHGADWVLLIARCLSEERARSLLLAAQERGLGVLFEIHGRNEAALAARLDAKQIGVNARDLDTLQMDVATAQEVLSSIPAGPTAIHLSGLKTPDDVRRLQTTRADAALVGEVLMRQEDPLPALQQLAAAARGGSAIRATN